MEKRLILESDYSENFSGISTDNIYLLSDEEAADLWVKYIDKKAYSFFRLPDDHWLLNTEQIFIAEWIKDYNLDNPERVREALSKQISWKDDDVILFCINKSRIIHAKWDDFKKFWINFIQCYDDAPVIINPSKKGCTVLIRSIGDIVKLGNCE